MPVIFDSSPDKEIFSATGVESESFDVVVLLADARIAR